MSLICWIAVWVGCAGFGMFFGAWTVAEDKRDLHPAAWIALGVAAISWATAFVLAALL